MSIKLTSANKVTPEEVAQIRAAGLEKAERERLEAAEKRSQAEQKRRSEDRLKVGKIAQDICDAWPDIVKREVFKNPDVAAIAVAYASDAGEYGEWGRAIQASIEAQGYRALFVRIPADLRGRSSLFQITLGESRCKASLPGGILTMPSDNGFGWSHSCCLIVVTDPQVGELLKSEGA